MSYGAVPKYRRQSRSGETPFARYPGCCGLPSDRIPGTLFPGRTQAAYRGWRRLGA